MQYYRERLEMPRRQRGMRFGMVACEFSRGIAYIKFHMSVASSSLQNRLFTKTLDWGILVFPLTLLELSTKTKKLQDVIQPRSSRESPLRRFGLVQDPKTGVPGVAPSTQNPRSGG